MLSDEKIIVEVAFARDPSLIHENVGAGFAVASQVKVTFPPSICVVFWGCAVISAGSAIKTKKVF